MKEDKLNKFSVSLGLLDYINPIFYSITIITILINLYNKLGIPYNIIMLIGAIISILFGFVIPTGKVLVGLGIIKFKMPVGIVFTVNTGILISGLTLLKYVLNLNIIVLLSILLIIIVLLSLIYKKTKSFNTIAVLTGAIGYLMLYISLITLSIKNSYIIPIILYGCAIVLFIILCGIGIKANLKNPKVHWIIEITNVICQFLVTLSTFIIFK